MFKKIMVPLDGSALAESVLPHLESLLKGFPDAEVVFVRVVVPDSIYASAEFMNVEESIERDRVMKSAAEVYLKGIVERLKHHEIRIHREILVGRLESSLIHYANQNDVDLILMATHGRTGIDRWIRGSVADGILRSADMPVMMVKVPNSDK